MRNSPCRYCTALQLMLLFALLPLAQATAEEGTVTEVELKLQVVEDVQLQDEHSQQAPAPLESSFGANEQAEAEPQPPPLPGQLSLAEALQRALANHPGIAALNKEQQVLSSLAWQEGRKPNPEVEIELEEFGGTQEDRKSVV